MARKKKKMPAVVEDKKIPHVEDGKIVIPVSKMRSFTEVAKILLSNPGLDQAQKQIMKSFLDVSKLTSDKGTSIPFVSTITGNFLVNPSSVSISTFQKMIDTDDICQRSTVMNTNNVIQGIGEYYHDDLRIQKFIRDAIKIVDGGLDGLVKQAYTNKWAGFWLGMIEDYIDTDGYTWIKKIRHLPQISVQFSAEPNGDIQDYWQYIYNYPYAGTQNMLSVAYNAIGALGYTSPYQNSVNAGMDQNASLGDMDYPYRTNTIQTFGLVQLDKRKVLHIVNETFNPGINPYGYPPRPLYDLWLIKTLIRKLWNSAMQRCANPTLVGYADATKSVTTDMPGQTLNAVEAMYNMMQTYTEESAIILPGLKGQMFDVQVVDNTGNFTVYENAYKQINSDIEKFFQIPEGLLSTSGSYAGATRQDGAYIRQINADKDLIVQNILLNGFCKYLIHKNFGENITNYGRFEAEIQSLEDKISFAKLTESKTNMGLNSPIVASDIQRNRRRMGDPEYTEEELQQVIEYNKLNGVNSPMDNSNRANTQETKPHYKNGANDGI